MLNLPQDFYNYNINEDFIQEYNYNGTQYTLRFLKGLSKINYLIINGILGKEGIAFKVNDLMFYFKIVDSNFILKIDGNEVGLE